MALRHDEAGRRVLNAAHPDGVPWVSPAQERCRVLEAERLAAAADIRASNRMARSKRSAQGQLAWLDIIMGKGLGAAKERAKLHRKIAEAAARSSAT